MSDSRQSRFLSLNRWQLGDWAALFGITLVVSVMCFVCMFLLGMHYFAAKESDVSWFYPVARLVSLAMVTSALGLITTGIVALLRRFMAGRTAR
jgi:hypothetical protein